MASQAEVDKSLPAGAAAAKARYPIDIIKYREGRCGPDGSGEITHEEYLKLHADLLSRDRWIIDGFESVALARERFAAADTLVYVDLPVPDALPVGHQASHQEPFSKSEGLAGERPGVEQHARQLPGGGALSSPIDAEVPAVCR
jgi:hypothetical protein